MYLKKCVQLKQLWHTLTRVDGNDAITVFPIWLSGTDPLKSLPTTNKNLSKHKHIIKAIS